MTNRKPNRLRVGVIGLGTIGSRAAANLRAAGHRVYVWNRSPRAEPNFLGSPGEVTDLCDALQLFVSDDAALLEIIRTVAPELRPRHLVLAHPTVSPETVRQAARIVEGTGARYLDAPFTGSRAAAGNGELVYYVAGPEAARRDALPVLEATSKNVVVIGDTVGQAMVTKIATNLFTATVVQSLAEALALARAAGIEPARFTEAMEHTSSRSGTSDFKLATMIKGDYATPHFALKHMLKDARLALRLAAAHGLTLPATATVAAQLYGADRRGWGDLDFAALAKNYDPAPPAPTPLPTVIPETLPPAPAPADLAPAPMPVAPPSAAPTLGLPAVPGETVASPATMPIPRRGLPFPPAEVPSPAASPAPVTPATLMRSTASPGSAGDSLPAVARDLPGERKFPFSAPPPGNRVLPVETLSTLPAEPSLPAPVGTDEPTAAETRLPARPEEPSPALPDAPADDPGAEPGPPSPPATRRTLLSWFQRGK